MAKLMKYAQNIDKALTALRGILIAVSVIIAAALVIGVIFAGSILDAANVRFGDFTTSMGGVSLRLWMNEPVRSVGDLQAIFASTMLLFTVILAISLYTIWLLKGIMGEMKEGRPFSETMPKRVRKTAYVIFAYAIVTPVLPFLPIFFTFRFLDIQGVLAASPLIENVKINYEYGINIVAICAGFMVLLLSLVFEYGAHLQRQSDETL